MDWTQFVVFLVTMGGMFLWIRTESRADQKALETKIIEDKKNLETKIAEDRRESMTLLTAIQQEIKDFHGRLSTLEEKYLQFQLQLRKDK